MSRATSERHDVTRAYAHSAELEWWQGQRAGPSRAHDGSYRERLIAAVGLRAVFPLWGKPTGSLARAFVRDGFRAMLVCVDPRQLDVSKCGREFDDDLLDALPAAVDPCGENGEFHTFVYDAPMFSGAIEAQRGEIVERGGFVFCDLLPGDVARATSGDASRGGMARAL